jgi:23S rRNA (uracil1939-C5)-methyltransferase
VVVELTEERADYARGRIVEIVRPAPERVEPRCQYFGECGGCSFQQLDYAAQLGLKRRIVVEQLRRIGHFESAEALVRPALGMLSPWEYRNHARFTIGRRFGELCFTRRGSRRLMRIDRCWIMQPPINEALGRLQDRVGRVKGHQVALRSGGATGQLMVTPAVPDLPELASGRQAIEEALFDRRFRVATAAFFQVNTRRERRPIPAGLAEAPWPLAPDGLSMAEILALVVHDRLAPRADDLLVDAYSGVGTFAILLARAVRQVVGIEESPAAVRDARHNAADLANVEFREGKAEALLPMLGRRPDALILDPARVGCQPAVLEALVELQVPRLVYVSCDPATLARDLRALIDGGYRLHDIQPVDMFPHTYHVEAVAALTWVGGNSQPSST